MLKRLINWLKGLGKEPVPVLEYSVPKPVSEDVWDIVVELATNLGERNCGKLNIIHFDIIVHTYSSNIIDLFKRLEMIIKCIDNELSVPSWWEERDNAKLFDCLPDFIFDERNEYWKLNDVSKILIEKVMIIHHLIAKKEINHNHPYYFYMRKEFYSIISDTIEILSKLVDLANDEADNILYAEPSNPL